MLKLRVGGVGFDLQLLSRTAPGCSHRFVHVPDETSLEHQPQEVQMEGLRGVNENCRLVTAPVVVAF